MGCLDNLACLSSITGRENRKALKLVQRGRTSEQKAVIGYFFQPGGCIKGFSSIDDTMYDNMLASRVKALDIHGMAMEKLGLDESQVQEIDPVFLDGYYFDWNDEDLGVKLGKDNVARSSKYDLTALYFSSEQIFIYSYDFDMTNYKTSEETIEYFYKDITSLSVETMVTEQLKAGGGCNGLANAKYQTNTFLSFSITVSNASFRCSMRPDNEGAIIGMKNLIRDKKQQ